MVSLLVEVAPQVMQLYPSMIAKIIEALCYSIAVFMTEELEHASWVDKVWLWEKALYRFEADDLTDIVSSVSIIPPPFLSPFPLLLPFLPPSLPLPPPCSLFFLSLPSPPPALSLPLPFLSPIPYSPPSLLSLPSPPSLPPPSLSPLPSSYPSPPPALSLSPPFLFLPLPSSPLFLPLPTGHSDSDPMSAGLADGAPNTADGPGGHPLHRQTQFRL